MKPGGIRKLAVRGRQARTRLDACLPPIGNDEVEPGNAVLRKHLGTATMRLQIELFGHCSREAAQEGA